MVFAAATGSTREGCWFDIAAVPHSAIATEASVFNRGYQGNVISRSGTNPSQRCLRASAFWKLAEVFALVAHGPIFAL